MDKKVQKVQAPYESPICEMIPIVTEGVICSSGENTEPGYGSWTY